MSQDIIYKIKADFLKVLGHPVRLKLIEELKHGEKSVGCLVDKFKIGQSSISRHLLALRNAGVLSSRQEKTTVYYNIADHDIYFVLRPIAVMLRKKFKASEKMLVTLGKD
ncbi:MAG: winged helix-turn-helix transcriptional regulator [Candidatus Omnitrophica bacterium]|nr:winged helix-turn-helix transcriptional regulator [Candidatus Omnitrophota bacterium]